MAADEIEQAGDALQNELPESLPDPQSEPSQDAEKDSTLPIGTAGVADAEGVEGAKSKKPHTVLIAVICSIVAFCLGIAAGAFGYTQYKTWQMQAALDYLSNQDDEDAAVDSSEEDEDESEDTASSVVRTGYDWYIDGELADTALTDLLPVPTWAEVDESANTVEVDGEVYDTTDEDFDVYLYVSSKDAFKEYVQALKDAGFDDVIDDDNSYFCADNDFGVEVDVDFENYGDGDKELEIWLWVWDSDEYLSHMGLSSSDLSSEQSSDSGSSGESQLIEFLDEYEDFVEDYVDFMEEYQNASYSEMASMLSDYNDMLEEYEELSEQFDSYDTDDMTDEEIERYLEVTERVAELLAEV